LHDVKVSDSSLWRKGRTRRAVMRERYMDLETGITLSLEEVLEIANHKEALWEAADELYSLLAQMAEDREAESQSLLLEAAIIREYLNAYDAAADLQEGNERGHPAAKKRRVAFIPPDEGNSYWLAGALYTVKAVGKDTGWAYTLVETKTRPKGFSLAKINYRQDTTFYVLEGELEFMVEGNLSVVSAGCFLYVGRGTWHSYNNVGTRPARHLEILTPAGIEKFFEEVSVPARDSSSPPPFEEEDLDRVLSVAPKYGLEIRPPSEIHN
jgi:mannose-6-phosphate isomerase-like protein (cupin superfamily)